MIVRWIEIRCFDLFYEKWKNDKRSCPCFLRGDGTVLVCRLRDSDFDDRREELVEYQAKETESVIFSEIRYFLLLFKNIDFSY